jgi:sterol desaturase/sphingolipid hydroxylase (fatty acid hydroxylase superfamily)
MKNLHSEKEKSMRLFNSSFLEFFTYTHWSVPIFLYLPLAVFLVWRSFGSLSFSFLLGASLLVAGILVWTLVEYLLHRFVFHYEPKSESGKKLHFLIHGVHHDYPNDSLRLVMPPLVSLPLALIFYTLFVTLLGRVYVLPFFAGFVLGYIVYDTMHYAIHHAPMRGKLSRFLKTQHMKHHFKNPDASFGVSSPLWDYVFRTKGKDQM